MSIDGGKLAQFTGEKNDPPFTLLNGQAGTGVNDRCEVVKILHTQPKTMVFVFAGGRQTGDKEFARDTLHQCHTEGSGKKVAGVCFSSDGLLLSGNPLERERKVKMFSSTLLCFKSATLDRPPSDVICEMRAHGAGRK